VQHRVVGREVRLAVAVGTTIIAPGRPLVVACPLNQQDHDDQQERDLPRRPREAAAELLVA